MRAEFHEPHIIQWVCSVRQHHNLQAMSGGVVHGGKTWLVPRKYKKYKHHLYMDKVKVCEKGMVPILFMSIQNKVRKARNTSCCTETGDQHTSVDHCTQDEYVGSVCVSSWKQTVLFVYKNVIQLRTKLGSKKLSINRFTTGVKSMRWHMDAYRCVSSSTKLWTHCCCWG